jgi:iron complex transport system ATP-binding protein
VVSLHDLGLAVRHCSRLIVVDRGGVVADGSPRSLLVSDLLRKTFGITAWFQDTPDGLVFQPLEVAT